MPDFDRSARILLCIACSIVPAGISVDAVGAQDPDDAGVVESIFRSQDHNADAMVTEAEASPRFWNDYAAADADGDSGLSLDELRSGLASGSVHPGGSEETKRRGQNADPYFYPAVPNPMHQRGSGPVVLLDEAHFNFHQLEGRFAPFGDLLSTDGYVVRAQRRKFGRDALTGGRVLVISNAIHEDNEKQWRSPIHSAFTDEEIEELANWVQDGGSVLLIADHMPFAGAAEKLAERFGANFTNGFAMRQPRDSRPMVFRRADGGLADHSMTRGQNESESIEFVATFTGSGFRIDDAWEPLFAFGDDVVSLNPAVAWQFTDATPTVSLKGWHQGAAREFGKGRIAIFGEAAMFTAQRNGRRTMGMNSADARQNQRFVLNVVHWLAGDLE